MSDLRKFNQANINPAQPQQQAKYMMDMNLDHSQPSKDKYEDRDEPLPEENLTDDSYENSKHLPNEIAISNNLTHNEQNGPVEMRDVGSRGASGMAQRERFVADSNSG
jgi:hypothetical protein